MSALRGMIRHFDRAYVECRGEDLDCVLRTDDESRGSKSAVGQALERAAHGA